MKKHKQHEEHIDETWLIPYSDLLTLLLALFIVLFASSQIDQKKFDQLSRSFSAAFDGGASLFEPSSVIPIDEMALDARQENSGAKDTTTDADEEDEELEQLKAQIAQETEDLRKLQAQIDQYIDENGLTTQLETKLDNERLVIMISDNALFDSGSAVVKQSAQRLAVAISDMLAGYDRYEIEVGGHTDDRPINTAEFPSNWDLSAKRALNFMKYLLTNESISPEKFKSIGYGEYHPVADNSSEEGRAKNRRVEVSIIRNFPGGQTISVE